MKNLKIIFILLAFSLAVFGCAEEGEKAAADIKMPAAEVSAVAQMDKGALSGLFGENLINAKGEKVRLKPLDGQIIGIYFSALWCPPCRQFTPVLVDAYNELKKQGKPFEIVFVSADRDKKAMMKYMNDYNMPWLAVEHGSPQVRNLNNKYSVRGIPYLVIIDSAGKTVSTNGREEVARNKAKAYDAWRK